MESRSDEKKWIIVVPVCLFGLLIFRQYQYAIVYLEERAYNNTVLHLGASGLLQLLQAALTILICLFAGKFISQVTGHGQRICFMLMLTLYGLVGNSVLKDSVFVFPYGMVNAGAVLLFFLVFYLFMKWIRQKERPFLTANRRWLTILSLAAGGAFLFLFVPEGAAKVCLGEEQWMLAVAVTLSAGGLSYLYFRKGFLLEISFLFAAFFPMDAFWEIPEEIADIVRLLWALVYLIILCAYFYKKRYGGMVLLPFIGCLRWIPGERTSPLPEYCFGVTFVLCCIAAVCILDFAVMPGERVERGRQKEKGMQIGLFLCILISGIVLWTGRREVVNYSIVGGEWYEDGWLGESVTLALACGRESSITLRFINVAQIENMDITCSIDGKETIYRLSVSGDDLVELPVPGGKSEMKLTVSETFMPESGDQRELSVLLKVLNGGE